MKFSGYETETDVKLFDEIRTSCIEIIDKAIFDTDKTQVIRTILEKILKVKDNKLATLLHEFNPIKEISPNFAAVGFRTILSLVIRERAKVISPASPLAQNPDFAFESSIREALRLNIFTNAEDRLLKRFIDGGDFDAFNNVTHKAGDNTLIDKSRLNSAVNMLNTLLPTIF